LLLLFLIALLLVLLLLPLPSLALLAHRLLLLTWLPVTMLLLQLCVAV
jgi:hypothetical protein